MPKNNLILNNEWAALFASLPDEKAGQLVKAAFATHNGECVSFDDPVLSAVYAMMAQVITENTEKYDRKCEQNARNRRGEETQNETTVNETERPSTTVNESEERAPIEYKEKKNNKTKIKKIKDTCPEPCSELAPVESIPLNDGTDWKPTLDEYNEFCRLYPAVNVKVQFGIMRGWCLGNPSRKKTQSGVRRFVTSWLSKEQDKGTPTRAAPQKSGFSDMARNYDFDKLEAALIGRVT